MRIGIIREFMVKHAKADEPIVDAAAKEMKAMLAQASRRDAGRVGDGRLGGRSRGREHDDVASTGRIAAAHAGAVSGAALPADAGRRAAFPAFAAKIEPTEFAPGKIFGTGTLQPVDWMLRWAEGLEPTPPNLNVRSVHRRGGSRAPSAST